MPWWSARKHPDDLSSLNFCAGVIAVLLIVPGVFAGGGGLAGSFLGLISVLPATALGILAGRRNGPRSARITFIATGVFVLMLALQLRG